MLRLINSSRSESEARGRDDSGSCTVDLVSYPATINIKYRMPVEESLEFSDFYGNPNEDCGEGKGIGFDPDNGTDPSCSTSGSDISKQ